MKFGRCGRCRHGITMMDGETPYTVCTLLPPQPLVTAPDKLSWIRPSMAMRGWCGQFRYGILRLFGYGPRT